MSEEIRVKDEKTGGEKGSKVCRPDLLPVDAIMKLAEHYGKNCKEHGGKYESRNWERGYKYSLSYAAAQRHLMQFWNGEDIDDETKSLHVIAAAWHCLAMAAFSMRGIGTDDRPKRETTPRFDIPSAAEYNTAFQKAKPLMAKMLEKNMKTAAKIWGKYNARKRKV